MEGDGADAGEYDPLNVSVKESDVTRNPNIDVYSDLGVRPIINCQSQRTALGGSLLSAAVTAMLAQGMDLIQAIGEAKRFTTRCIESSRVTGSGGRSLNHVHGFRPPIEK